jgi:TRAP-type C4-dicarboxylate transport system substrate-binding protein
MHSARRRVAARAVIAVVLLAMTTACTTTQGADKTGGDTVVLRLATFDGEVNTNGQNHGLQAFVDNLGKVSGGRLKVEVTTDYGDGAPDAESRLVRAIASGELDGGWPSTRAFAKAGIAGLEVVEAPMTIASYAAEKALVSGPMAAKLLARLDGSGVVGLGLAVGPLRRPFAAKTPLLGPEDWKGIRFRVYNSPVQADAVRALGASPANLSFSFIDQIRAGSLRGAELDIAQYEHIAAGPEAGNVTANVVLWPKVFVLSLSQKRFDALTAQQQTWVREAAKQAVKVSVDAVYDEASSARTLCGRGARFPDATPAQVQGLRAKLRPVLDRLAADPTSAQLLRDIQAVANEHPAPEVLDVPASCRQSTASKEPLGPVPATVSVLPDGVYRRQLTHQEVEAAGGDPGHHPAGTWTLRVRGGTFQISCRPVEGLGVSCGDSGIDTDTIVEAGDLRGTGRTVYFVNNSETLSRLTGCKLPATNQDGHCGPPVTHRMTWALSGDQLSFSDYRGDTEVPMEWTGGPWRKIA